MNHISSDYESNFYITSRWQNFLELSLVPADTMHLFFNMRQIKTNILLRYLVLDIKNTFSNRYTVDDIQTIG